MSRFSHGVLRHFVNRKGSSTHNSREKRKKVQLLNYLLNKKLVCVSTYCNILTSIYFIVGSNEKCII